MFFLGALFTLCFPGKNFLFGFFFIWQEKSCSASATSDDCKLTSIGDVKMSSLSFSCTFSFVVSSSLERKSAALFWKPATCMIRNLNWRT